VYDEAKYRAHQVAEQRIAAGAPVVIVQPAGVYGPGDHSELGNTIDQASKGLTPLIPFASAGFCMVHVDDVARGIVAAYDKGRTGESYVLAGDTVTMKELVQLTARLAGKYVPRYPLPTTLIKLSAPLGPLIGPLLGFPPNLKELISAFDGVTYWASDAKARSELGFETRPLNEGLAELLN
ncbi:MAG: NAD-dependent epimerase/dehydratase family protein, partial [Solirubrobacterales bacterium]|nr:NAD-dependent epimerase/dehydratase family protein [Solirubrobacterales bacterium]